MRKYLTTIALASALALGLASAVGATPPDRPRVTSVQASSTRVHFGDSLTVIASARDEGSAFYFTRISTDPNIPMRVACAGTVPNEPSPDGSLCEYDLGTTSAHGTTQETATIEITFATPSQFSVTACAGSFSNPQNIDCKTRQFTVG